MLLTGRGALYYVVSYLMGWPNHYCSHSFVNVYLIGIERYLEKSLIEVTNRLVIVNVS